MIVPQPPAGDSDWSDYAAWLDGKLHAGALNAVADYGAAGNGTTDDTAAIQAALNGVGAQGGAVYLPTGRYKVSSTLLIRRPNTLLFGDGPANYSTGSQGGYGTRLEASGTLAGGPMLRTQLDTNDMPVHGVTIRDLTLDGMDTATGAGLHFRSNRGLLSRVHVHNFGGHAFHLQGYPTWDLYDSMVAFCQGSDCGGSGLYLDDGATDMHFLHDVLFTNQHNMQLVGGGSAQVTSCHFYDAVIHDVYFNGAGSRSKFVNCKIEGAGKNGVLIDSTPGGYSDIQFSNCNLASHGRDSVDQVVGNEYDWFAIVGPSANGVSRTTITGCTFTTKSGTPRARYFLSMSSAAQQTLVAGNNFGPAAQYSSGVVSGIGSTGSPARFAGNGGFEKTYTTATRPTVTSVPVGMPIFDTTLGRPVWNNGTAWVDATGTPV